MPIIESQSTRRQKPTVSHRTDRTNTPSRVGESSVKTAFQVWFPASALNANIAEVIHALYYLPENFVLLLPRDNMLSDEIPMLIEGSPLEKRIVFYKAHNAAYPPMQNVSAVICSNTYVPKLDIPKVIVSSLVGGLTSDNGDYTVGQSPEAIASALLDIARNK